jgi:alanyl-tRNA synthetase
MHEAYPDLEGQEERIGTILMAEEERFLQTIDQGMAILEEELSRLPSGSAVSGDRVFTLYDTYGFPPDLTDLIARERGHSIDQAGYESRMEEQRERARQSGQLVGVDAAHMTIRTYPPEVLINLASRFVGYDQLQVDTVIEDVKRSDDRYLIILHKNPFYARGGGQVSDSGEISGANFRLRVADVIRLTGDIFVPVAELIEGSPENVLEGAAVTAVVDAERRRQTERHHTVTHVLHAVLRKRLGEHVRQAGSLVAPDRMRFDFSHPRPLDPGEIAAIEDEANRWVLEDLTVRKEILSFDEARSKGATALFGEKYGDRVRVVSIGEDRSIELCGGCHVERTGQIGVVRILSESSAAGGVRRIEVVTGPRAVEEFRRRESLLAEAAERLRVSPDEVPSRVDRLIEEKRLAERGLEQARRKTGIAGAGDLGTSTNVNGVEVVTLRAEPASMDDLRAIGDALRSRIRSGVGVVGAELNGKANLLAVVTDDLIQQGTLDAPSVIRELACLIGGGGGGKKHMAQAGGKDVERIDEALDRAPEIVAGLVEG